MAKAEIDLPSPQDVLAVVQEQAREIERLRTQRNVKAQEIIGWKRTALAMRDEAIHWMRDGKSRYDEIEILYFNAAMFNKFAPGDAFAHEQAAPEKTDGQTENG